MQPYGAPREKAPKTCPQKGQKRGEKHYAYTIAYTMPSHEVAKNEGKNTPLMPFLG